jgi:hypothetical protein
LLLLQDLEHLMKVVHMHHGDGDGVSILAPELDINHSSYCADMGVLTTL